MRLGPEARIIALRPPFVVAALPLLLLSAPLSAQPGEFASASGTANATIVAPLRLESVAPLEFGTVEVSATEGGSITVTPSGLPPILAGSLRGACAASGDCTARPAQFAVFGAPGRHYRVDYPEEAPAHPVSGTGPSLAVTQLTHAFENGEGPGGRGLLGQDGTGALRIGGTLELPAATPAGIYRATLDVVVSYD